MKKKIIIVLILIVLLIIPFFIFNDNNTNNIKKDPVTKKHNKYPVESDNDKEASKKEKFIYETSKYDNINEFIKEEIKEVEEIKYVCIKEGE